MGQKYVLSIEQEKRLEQDYTYIQPKGDQSERYLSIRAKAKELATLIMELTPPSREQSLALTALSSDVVMNANAAIARNE